MHEKDVDLLNMFSPLPFLLSSPGTDDPGIVRQFGNTSGLSVALAKESVAICVAVFGVWWLVGIGCCCVGEGAPVLDELVGSDAAEVVVLNSGCRLDLVDVLLERRDDIHPSAIVF